MAITTVTIITSISVKPRSARLSFFMDRPSNRQVHATATLAPRCTTAAHHCFARPDATCADRQSTLARVDCTPYQHQSGHTLPLGRRATHQTHPANPGTAPPSRPPLHKYRIHALRLLKQKYENKSPQFYININHLTLYLYILKNTICIFKIQIIISSLFSNIYGSTIVCKTT